VHNGQITNLNGRKDEGLHELTREKNKMIMNFVCAIIMNGVFAGLYGWFAFPNSNLDTMKVWETRLAERETYTDETFEANFLSSKDKMGFWSEGACFYTPTTVDGIENMIPEF
jgi:hypothetical protein